MHSDTAWKPIDFQGIVNIDQPLVDQLDAYLDEKESQIGNGLSNLIHLFPVETMPVSIPFSAGRSVVLSDVVQSFVNNLEELISSGDQKMMIRDLENAVIQINRLFWEYNEVLEGCVTELFQQLNQIGFEKWHPGLLGVVTAIKRMLGEHLDSMANAIGMLEAELNKFRRYCDVSIIEKLRHYWNPILDRSLLTYLKKTKKYLNIQYKSFAKRFENYSALSEKIHRSMQKFESYRVFSELDDSTQKNFKEIYRLIKLWIVNEKGNYLPPSDTIQALRRAYSMDKATLLFREYHDAIRNALFERSRRIKRGQDEFYTEVISKPLAQDLISGYKRELHSLGATIARYRDFYLKTHPNPYVRSRWGFTEWVVGPEPKKSKDLLNLVYEVEKLEGLYEKMENSLQIGVPSQDSMKLARTYREIETALHDMGQPLTTRSVMRARAEKVLDKLDEMNELGSTNAKVVPFVGRVFAKALRADWQYHVLFEFPKFHQLYEIHQGILKPIQNRQHTSRIHRFKELITQIEDWVKTRTTHRHIHEIEEDMNDMRESLQEFLAYVQRESIDLEVEKQSPSKLISEISRQMLEYRYLFGDFFYHLHQYEPDGKLIRNQFLFVDQYFETVENKLQLLQAIE